MLTGSCCAQIRRYFCIRSLRSFECNVQRVTVQLLLERLPAHGILACPDLDELLLYPQLHRFPSTYSVHVSLPPRLRPLLQEEPREN